MIDNPPLDDPAAHRYYPTSLPPRVAAALHDGEPRWHRALNHGTPQRPCPCWHLDVPGDASAAERRTAAGIRADRWPYGPNIDLSGRIALLDWAAATGYRLATPNARCLHWLLGRARRCSALQSYYHPGQVDQEHLWLDHPTFWTRAGRPALILAQPYTAPPREWVEQMTTDWAVDVRVTEESPWYGFPTHGVFITPLAAEESA